MRKEIRRIIMFCTILTVGLLLLLIDITFIQLLFLIIGLSIVLPFLLGMVTIAEVREALAAFKEQRLKKINILKKLDEIKFFEKKDSQKPVLPQPKVMPKAEPAAKPASKFPFAPQITSLASTFGSLGTLLKERTRRERKVEDINKMLDKAVTGKVEAAIPAGPAKDTTLPPVPGVTGMAGAPETDPFLSLSEDEFDAGLLDGLDDTESEPAAAALTSLDQSATGSGTPAPGPDVALPEPELSVPSLEMDSAASDILKAHGGEEGLDEFSGLDAVPEGDSEELDGLDGLSLDDVEIDEDEMAAGGNAAPENATVQAPAASGPGTPGATPAADASSPIKTAWIPSDAPKDADQSQDQIGTQADMASFAQGASGTDEDLLSSIASDVKRNVKEKDISLLRELKDFKAPANQIENELTDMYQKLSSVPKPREKAKTSTNEIK